jgi:hypothetical protein
MARLIRKDNRNLSAYALLFVGKPAAAIGWSKGLDFVHTLAIFPQIGADALLSSSENIVPGRL